MKIIVKQILLLVFTFALLNVNQNSLASTKVVKIFDEIIYQNDLILDEEEKRIVSISYSHLADSERLRKEKEYKLDKLIWPQIIKHFSKSHNIEPSDALIASARAFFLDMPIEYQTQLDLKSKDERQSFQQAQFTAAYEMAKLYLLSKALYEEYGGQVIFQQGNPNEPVGAYLGLLNELKENDQLIFFDTHHESAFYYYYLRAHTMIVDPEDVDFSKPWWEAIP